jgi:hypothetical protein
MEPIRKFGFVPEVHLRNGPTETADPPLTSSRATGAVKTKAEIAATLTPRGRNRGLWFDWEMMPFCGRTFRVRQRVRRIIDERDGRMLEFKSDCVTLEGVVCSGDLSLRRWFCSRAIYPFWRECWLRRAEDAPAAAVFRGGQPRHGGRPGASRLEGTGTLTARIPAVGLGG